MDNNKAATTRTATIAFMEHHHRIQSALEKLQKFQEDHYGANPDKLNWGDVSDISFRADAINQIVLNIENNEI